MNRRQFFSLAGKALPAPAAGYWLHVNREAMACRFEVTLPSEDQQGVRIAQATLDRIDQLEDQLTIFRDTSELSQINRTAAAEPVQVEAGLFDLLTLAQKLARETGGAFDPTAGPLTKCWGFYRRQGHLPEAPALAAARAVVGMDQVNLNSETQTIQFAQPGVELNLGSIGKGYALDVVAGVMRRQGVKAALLNGGSSSVLALGPAPTTEGWLVGLRHPRRRDRRWATLRLRDCAMATSGRSEQYFEVEGKRYGHIIDPRTGYPAEGVALVTVVAPTAAAADALATAFFVGGPELAAEYCQTHTDVLVLLHREAELENPIVLGSHRGCRWEII